MASFMITKVLSQGIVRLTMSENIHTLGAQKIYSEYVRRSPWVASHTDTRVAHTKTYPKVLCTLLIFAYSAKEKTLIYILF